MKNRVPKCLSQYNFRNKYLFLVCAAEAFSESIYILTALHKYSHLIRTIIDELSSNYGNFIILNTSFIASMFGKRIKLWPTFRQ